MEPFLCEALHCSKVVRMGRGGSGCISEGEGYSTDHGQVFVKRNKKSDAKQMFQGEYAGLKAIELTNTVRVPKPIMFCDNPINKGAVLIMEYLDMSGLSKYSGELGHNLAKMHLYNENVALKSHESTSIHKSDVQYIAQFGFDEATCCGAIPLDNHWCSNWVSFYTVQRLQNQLNMIEKEYNDREARELWSILQLKIPSFFKDVEITPALLHGDLWSGNAAEINSEPVIFDPASFYGHSEFELAIAGMFGGFNTTFHAAYHSLIPKQPGFSQRKDLYQLFHYLNHWNHFGTGYRSSSISILKRLTN